MCKHVVYQVECSFFLCNLLHSFLLAEKTSHKVKYYAHINIIFHRANIVRTLCNRSAELWHKIVFLCVCGSNNSKKFLSLLLTDIVPSGILWSFSPISFSIYDFSPPRSALHPGFRDSWTKNCWIINLSRSQFTQPFRNNDDTKLSIKLQFFGG
jgi:hypothetical protein